jgi:hypothetical protein
MAILILIFMFIGFWVPRMIQCVGPLAPLLFLFSLVWELCTARKSAERMARGVSSELRPVVKRYAMGLECITAFIGYWFAGIATMRMI